MEISSSTPFSVSVPSSPNLAKQSLLSTTVTNCTKEVLFQLNQIDQFAKVQDIKNLDEKQIQVLQNNSEELVKRINALLVALSFLPFEIKKTSKIPSKNQAKRSELTDYERQIKIQNLSTQCLKMVNLCHSEKIMKEKWTKKDVESLKADLTDFIAQLNNLSESYAVSSLMLSEKNKFQQLVAMFKSRSDLQCEFENKAHRKHWEKVEEKVNEFLKNTLLIDVSQKIDKQDQWSILSDIPELEGLLKERLFLKQKKEVTADKQKLKEIKKDLQRGEIHILGAYQRKLTSFANGLLGIHSDPSEKKIYQALDQIFKDCLKKKYSSELASALFKAMAHSLTTHYIENTLENHILEKIRAMFKEWKMEAEKEKGSIPVLDYATLVETHWDRLLHLETLNSDEMKRALLGEYIQIIDETGKVLLAPPKKTKAKENSEDEIQRINAYLPLTEQYISKQIGDPTGTLLTKFREIGHQLIQQSAPQNANKPNKTESVLDMDQQIFNVFAPVMKQIEDGIPLTAEQEGLLKYVEDLLQKENPDIFKKYSLKQIARFLFSLHRILNQSFMIGTMTVLRTALNHIFPDKNQTYKIGSLENENPTALNVVFGQNERVALEWQMTNKIHVDNLRFIHRLRIDLPPLGSTNLKGNVHQEFTFKTLAQSSARKETNADQLLEEELAVKEKIFNIRLLLKAMYFPEGTFNQVS